MNTNFNVISLARLKIKPRSTAPKADALTTRPWDTREETLPDTGTVPVSSVGRAISAYTVQKQSWGKSTGT